MKMWSVSIKRDEKEVKIGELTESEFHYHYRKRLFISVNRGKHTAVAINNEKLFCSVSNNKKLVENYKRVSIEFRKLEKN